MINLKEYPMAATGWNISKQVWIILKGFYSIEQFWEYKEWEIFLICIWRSICSFITPDNGSPIGSSMFFGPTAQATTTIVVVPQNMEEPLGLPLHISDLGVGKTKWQWVKFWYHVSVQHTWSEVFFFWAFLPLDYKK